jgi:hypothetical protein
MTSLARPSKLHDGYYQSIAHERVQREHKDSYWYNSEAAVFNPDMADMRRHNAIERFILRGWLPKAPFIDRTTNICAFGSCFAANISNYLKAMDYTLVNRGKAGAYVVQMSESLVTTFAIRQQFEWALENKQPQIDLWYGYKGALFEYDEAIRLETRDLFMKTDVFILTFGLSEVWYDEPTGEVFWKAVPRERVDPARHKFRVSTVQENRDNIRAIYDLIRKHRPDAKIICTLSPIPLMATFRPVSTITANAVSKAVLRAAVDEVYREVAAEGLIHYWPSYEIVMEGFGQNPYGGHFCADRRHADELMLAYIMRLFETHYCTGERSGKSVLRHYVEARVSTSDLPPEILQAMEQGRRALQTLIDQYDDPTAELLEKLALELYPAAPTQAPSSWAAAAVGWQTLPDQQPLGPNPAAAPVPAGAWGYGAMTIDGFKASEDEEMHVQVTLASECPVQVLMSNGYDGSQIGTDAWTIQPEDGEKTVAFHLFPEDETAHVVIRNAGEEGIGGSAAVRAIEIRKARCGPPVRKA